MSAGNNPDRLREHYLKALQFEKKRALYIEQKEKELNVARRGWHQIQANTENTLDLYAKGSCRDICDKILVTFPREVRDMIYRHLLVGWPMPPKNGWGDIEQDERVVCTEALLDVRDVKHLLQEEYIGITAIREIQELFFHTTTFQLEADCKEILKLRFADPLLLNIFPADYVLSIRLRFQCEDYDFPQVKPLDTIHFIRYPRVSRNSTAPSAMLPHLECLFAFKQGSKFVIDLNVDPEELVEVVRSEDKAKQWMWDKVVVFIFPTLCRLGTAGYKVTIRMNSDDLMFDIFNDDRPFEEYQLKLPGIETTLPKKTKSLPDWDAMGTRSRIARDDLFWCLRRTSEAGMSGVSDDLYVGVQDLFSSTEE